MTKLSLAITAVIMLVGGMSGGEWSAGSQTWTIRAIVVPGRVERGFGKHHNYRV